MLHGASDQAVRWQLIARNPADAVDQPRKVNSEFRPLNAEQAVRFLDAVRGNDLEALYVIALTTGMRQGELLGLAWSDVEWDGRRLHVRYTLSRMRGRWWLDDPKTEKSRRSIELTEATLMVLRGHRARQAERLLGIGHRLQEADLVFCDAVGDPLHGRHVTTRSFRQVLERAELPRIRFHDLRHTAATLLLASGIPVTVVSEMLGHTTTATTQDVYAQVLPTMQADAVRKLDAVLRRGAS